MAMSEEEFILFGQRADCLKLKKIDLEVIRNGNIEDSVKILLERIYALEHLAWKAGVDEGMRNALAIRREDIQSGNCYGMNQSNIDSGTMG